MKKFLTILLLIAFVQLKAQEAMTDWVEVSATADHIATVSNDKFVYVLTEDNKGFHVHTFQRVPFTYLNNFTFEDKIEKTSLEFFRAYNSGGHGLFLFRGYDRDTKEDGIYTLYPGDGDKQPVKVVGFPEKPIRAGNIKVSCEPSTTMIGVIYVPDQTSTKEQRTYFASVDHKRLVSFLEKTYPHKGELMRYDDVSVDEEGGVFVTVRKYTDTRDAKDDVNEELEVYEPMVGYLPAGGKELMWSAIPKEGQFIYQMKFVRGGKTSKRIVALTSKYDNLITSGMAMFTASKYNESLETNWMQDLDNGMISRAVSSPVAEFYQRRRGRKDRDKTGIYHLNIKEVFQANGSVYPILQEEKIFERRELIDISRPYAVTDQDQSRLSRANDVLFFGAMWFLELNEEGFVDYTFENRSVMVEPKEYEGYSYQVAFNEGVANIYYAQDRVDDLRELGPLFQPTKDHRLKTLEMAPGKMVRFEILYEFRNTRTTPDVWQFWPEVDGIFVVEEERKEFRLLRF